MCSHIYRYEPVWRNRDSRFQHYGYFDSYIYFSPSVLKLLNVIVNPAPVNDFHCLCMGTCARACSCVGYKDAAIFLFLFFPHSSCLDLSVTSRTAIWAIPMMLFSWSEWLITTGKQVKLPYVCKWELKFFISSVKYL